MPFSVSIASGQPLPVASLPKLLGVFRPDLFVYLVAVFDTKPYTFRNLTKAGGAGMLVEALIQTVLGRLRQSSDPNSSSVLMGAGRPEWEDALRDIELHRLAALVAFSIREQEFDHAVPPEILARLSESHRRTILTNTALFKALDRVLALLRLRGIDPVFFKGAVLADTFYPDFGTRSMGDVDFLVQPENFSATAEVLLGIGFTPIGVGADGTTFANSIGVTFDVHHRFRLFEMHDLSQLTTKIAANNLVADEIRVFEPAAMLAHLVYHSDEHKCSLGYDLSWLLDLVFVVRRWGSMVDVDRIGSLLPEERNLISFFRTLLMFSERFSEDLPEQLLERASTVEALRLEEILRNRRLSQWGLPRPKGWLRLGARFAGWAANGRRLPKPSDLFLWPLDIARENKVLRSL
jgi:hypothetical protein